MSSFSEGDTSRKTEKKKMLFMHENQRFQYKALLHNAYIQQKTKYRIVIECLNVRQCQIILFFFF